jgi:hypothetical protein
MGSKIRPEFWIECSICNNETVMVENVSVRPVLKEKQNEFTIYFTHDRG